MTSPRVLSSSAGLGWRPVHAETRLDPAQLGDFPLAPAPDLNLVLVTAGRYRIESRRAGAWRAADYAPGSVAVTAPGVASLFRWRSSGQRRLESLHVRLPAARVHRALDDAGVPHSDVERLDTLALDDPYASAALAALGRALDAGAAALYADSVAEALLVHLVHGGLAGDARRGRVSHAPGALGPREFARVIDYMTAELAADIDLDRLAGLVNISKFHFLRMFTRTAGVTPHRYLVELRLRRAAQLLRGTAMSVQQVAAACGYRSPSRFAAAFRRRYGLLPTAYRR